MNANNRASKASESKQTYQQLVDHHVNPPWHHYYSRGWVGVVCIYMSRAFLIFICEYRW